MYTLRLTRPLLQRFAPPDPADGPEPVATTRLGDWYATRIGIGRQRLILCTSQRSLLSVVVPARDLPGLPERLVIALVAALRAIGASPEAIATEVDQMTTGRIGSTRSRVVLGAMTRHARLAQRYAAARPGPADLHAIGLMLADDLSARLAGERPRDVALRLLMDPSHA